MIVGGGSRCVGTSKLVDMINVDEDREVCNSIDKEVVIVNNFDKEVNTCR